MKVTEQKEIEFYGDNVIAVRVEDGAVYVPVRPLCELIGVDWNGQRTKLNKDPVLSGKIASVEITLQVRDNRQTIKSNMIALPLDYLNGWLFGINANRVKDEIRDSLIQYQTDCYRVLFEAFGRNEPTARPDDELMQSADPSAVAYRNALSIAKIAREHYYLTKQVQTQEKQIGRLDQRLSLVEANLGNDDRHVTKEQASNLSQGVRAIGTVLSKRSGKNEYAAVYGELYRTWSVASYKEVPAVNYETVIAWLRNWYLELVDDSDCPF